MSGGPYEKATLGTLAMSHSSGKEEKSVQTQTKGKTSGIPMVPTVESTFPEHQAYRTNGRICFAAREKKCKAKCGIDKSSLPYRRVYTGERRTP